MVMHCISNIYIRKRLIQAITLVLMSMSCGYITASAESEAKPVIALLGDSMTWIGGDSCQNPTGWSHHLKSRGIADRVDVYARSGATWTNTSKTRRDTVSYSEILDDDNVIFNQALRLRGRVLSGLAVNPDVVLVFAGANDVWFGDRRPGMFDEKSVGFSEPAVSTAPSTVTTLKGSVSLVCDVVREVLPEARIVIVTPVEMSKAPAVLTEKVSDAIEESALSRGAEVLRADKWVDIRHIQEASSPTYTSDGVHTNPRGASILADFIISGLMKSKDNAIQYK